MVWTCKMEINERDYAKQERYMFVIKEAARTIDRPKQLD